MGALFNTLPGYQSFANPEINAKFAKAWGVPSKPTKPGVPLVEVPEAIMEDKLKHSISWVKIHYKLSLILMRLKSFREVELLIVQDIFMTQTAAEADILLPATSVRA